MAVPRRVAGIVLAVVALGLTATGLVLAATDPYPNGNSKDPLVLNGYPPRSTRLHVVISTGQTYDVTANVDVNFATNAVEAIVKIPFAFSTTTLDLRWVGGHLYGTLPGLSSIVGTHWFSVATSSPSLYGFSLEMTRPDISLISGFPEQTVTRNGYRTTYDYRRNNVALSAPSGLALPLATRASIDFSVTVGKQSELTAASFAVRSTHSSASISATVLSYNHPAPIVAPPAKDVTPINTSQLGSILGSTPFGKYLKSPSVPSLGGVLS